MTPDEVAKEFDEQEAIRRSLDALTQQHVPALDNYYDSESHGFHHKYGDPRTNHISVSSTATCVMSLVATGKWSFGPWRDQAAALAGRMLEEKWESAGLRDDNVFTVSFILEAVTDLIMLLPDPEERRRFILDHDERLTKAVNILQEQIADGAVSLDPYPSSAYLTQLVVRVLKKVKQLPNGVDKKVIAWARQEIDHQLALFMAGSKTADPYQLAYSIMLVASLGNPAEASPDNNLILRTAIGQLFERQLPDGSWPRSRPLFHYPTVGSAYCYEYEMLVQLLGQPQLQDDLLDYVAHIGKAVEALNKTSYKLQSGGLGWSSGHHSQIEGPESWSTSSVYHFAHMFDRLVAESIRRSIFSYLDRVYVMKTGMPQSGLVFDDSFLDCPVERDGHQFLKTVLTTFFVEPIANGVRNIEPNGSLPKGTPVSAIFYGPPGTSKTELAKLIADYLGWPLLSIDPSHFVRRGLDQVQAEADRIFGMLAAAERIVVLLDEFDEMVRDRAHASEVLSRFLTTAMLPRLATINKSRRIVFIVATNYIDQFDLAISRQGRFDMLIQVMPPTVDEKLRHWSRVEERLGQLGVTDKEIRGRLNALTFGEFEALAQNIKDAEDAEVARQAILRSFEECTLQSKVDYNSLSLKTWGEACIEQRGKMRFPPRPNTGRNGRIMDIDLSPAITKARQRRPVGSTTTPNDAVSAALPYKAADGAGDVSPDGVKQRSDRKEATELS